MAETARSQIHISVRGLVEFILRHGDIDNRRKSSSGPEVMLEGANIHRMIQRRMGRNYIAEVYLKCTVSRGDVDIVIDGRADGIIFPSANTQNEDDVSAIGAGRMALLEMSGPDDTTYDTTNDALMRLMKYDGENADLTGTIVIDEIKTTYRDLERIASPEREHLAQAMCYAYMVADMADLPKVGVRMTYCNTETMEIRYFDSIYTRREISEWFRQLLRSYVRWADFETGWYKIRNMSIETMEFPYVYRPGQRELMGQVYGSIDRGERLFEMAPTGVGKTLANVYPSLKAIAADKADRIFYLTAKTITRTAASSCINILRDPEGNDKPPLRLKSVVITAKEKICPLEKCECNPEACPYAGGHYDRINDAMYDLLINEDEFSRENITEYAARHRVCPFEYSLDMSLFSDMIICDYNYVFDPNVYLRRFFGEGAQGRFLFLVDEAHNLVERAMKMYSARLVKEDFLDIKRLVKDYDPKLERALEGCNRHLLALKKECEDIKVVDSFEAFVNLLLRLSARIEQFLDDHEHFDHSDELLEFYFDIRHFLNIYENMNERDYVQYARINDDMDFEVDLMCANPARPVRTCTDRAVFTVFFSATLLPIEYYKKMLGADAADPAVYAKSVFDPAKRSLIIARDVTSRYKRRSDSEYDRMAEYISAVVSAKTGNYMIFFPSFAMLERVFEMYMVRYHDPATQNVVVQSSSMTESEREDFLAMFRERGSDDRMLQDLTLPDIDGLEIEIDETLDEEPDKTLLGFCVLGGIFSEGIDLKNDALIGALVIGTGLPMVCAERELLKRCYDDMGLDGFAYAYRFPGMNKVLQAAGRVIRTEEDRGVVALLDERFLGRDYRQLFPREWSNHHVCRVDDIGEILENFWADASSD